MQVSTRLLRLPENRAKRIVALLAPKDDWDKGAVPERCLLGMLRLV